MTTQGIETNDYFEARRGTLIRLYGKVKMASFIVAPSLIAMYVVHIFRYPCWQTKVMLGVALFMGACFVLAARVASRGYMGWSTALVVGSTTIELFAALLLRNGAGSSTSIALVCLMTYVALFSERALSRGALAGGVALVAGSLISYSNLIPRFVPNARESLASEIGFIVLFVWAISYLLRQSQIISAELFEGMRRTSNRQREVLATIGDIEPQLRATVGGIRNTSDAFEAQAGEQARISRSINLATSELASMVGTTVAAAEEARLIAGKTRDASLASRDRLSAVEGAFNNAVQRIESAQQRIDGLAAKISSTAEINRAIREIAENLKVLSVNASIESAKAGEYGRGFSLIAEELRRLVAKSKSDLQSSGALLEDIREDASAIAADTARSTDELRSCFGELRTTGTLVQQITDSFAITSTQVDQIAGAAQNQEKQIAGLSTATSGLDAAATQLTNAAATLSAGMAQIGRVDGALRDILAANSAADGAASASRQGPDGSAGHAPGVSADAEANGLAGAVAA